MCAEDSDAVGDGAAVDEDFQRVQVRKAAVERRAGATTGQREEREALVGREEVEGAQQERGAQRQQEERAGWAKDGAEGQAATSKGSWTPEAAC